MKTVPVSLIISRLCLLAAFILGAFYLPRASFLPRSAYGPVIHEEVSEFSKIRVRGKKSQRHLLFVSDSGGEGLQSSIDLKEPGELQVPYTRWLFASLLFKPRQEKVLIIGLGGGGMVRFIQGNLPETHVDVVEIDPAVVAIADQYFETRPDEQTNIYTEDAFVYIEESKQKYDVIYMDAFLRPGVDSEAGSATARLRTVEFVRQLKARLKPDGLLACNLVTRRKTTPADLAALREVFKTVKQLPVPGTGESLRFRRRPYPGLDSQ